jgi:hypothetical protein
MPLHRSPESLLLPPSSSIDFLLPNEIGTRELLKPYRDFRSSSEKTTMWFSPYRKKITKNYEKVNPLPIITFDDPVLIQHAVP